MNRIANGLFRSINPLNSNILRLNPFQKGNSARPFSSLFSSAIPKNLSLFPSRFFSNKIISFMPRSLIKPLGFGVLGGSAIGITAVTGTRTTEVLDSKLGSQQGFAENILAALGAKKPYGSSTTKDLTSPVEAHQPTIETKTTTDSLLLQEISDPNLPKDHFKGTARGAEKLLRAIKDGDGKSVDFLIEQGAGYFGNKEHPIQAALTSTNDEIAKVVIEKYASKISSSLAKRFARLAIQEDKQEAFNLLISLKGDAIDSQIKNSAIAKGWLVS